MTALVDAAADALGPDRRLDQQRGDRPQGTVPGHEGRRTGIARIAVNLRGMFLVAQAVAGRMLADRRGGVIVNMASTNALGGEEGFADYNASKGGVLQLTRTMALELGGAGHPRQLPVPRVHRHAVEPRAGRRGRVPGVRAGQDPAGAAGSAPRRSPPPMRSWPRTRRRSSTVRRSSSTADRPP